MAAGRPSITYRVGSWLILASPNCLSWRSNCTRVKGPSAVALRSSSGQAWSILESTKEDGPAGMADSAIRVVSAHLSATASELAPG